MSQDDVMQIRVGKNGVGIIGLRTVMEDMAGNYGERPDREVEEELLNRLSRKNYIPDRARGDYGRAFLREFKKSQGRPHKDEKGDEIEIKVLGTGCTACDMLEREVIEAMAEMNLEAWLEHVSNPLEIGGYGVMGTPALIVNGEVKCVGRVPPRIKIKEWLKEAQKQ